MIYTVTTSKYENPNCNCFYQEKIKLSYHISLINLTYLTYFELAQISSTRIFHIFRSSIAFFGYFLDKPVSFLSWFTYITAGLPLFLVPCFGSHICSRHSSSSFLLHICPVDLNLLALSTAVILLSLP